MGKAKGDWGTYTQEFLQRLKQIFERVGLGGGEAINDSISK